MKLCLQDYNKNILERTYSELPIGSIIPLNCSAHYVPEGCLPCDSGEYSKAQFEELWDNYLIGKDVFDPDSITVVGSPTVTDDGIFSNGSTTNYLTIPNSIVKQLEGNNAWKINFGGVMPLTQYSSNITGENSFNTGRLNIGSINGSGNFFLHFYNENDTAYGVYIPAGVRYNFGKEFIGYCSYDGSQTYTVALSFDNGITWQKETKEITDTVYFGESDLKIGYNLQTGNIDLKQFSIIVNGKTVFDCLKNQPLLNTCSYEEYEQDLATYGQCGNFAVKPLSVNSSVLNVSENATVSNDCIATVSPEDDEIFLAKTFDPQDKTWAITIKATVGTAISVYRSLLGTGIPGKDNQGIAWALDSNGRLIGWASSNGTGWDIGKISGTKVHEIGKTYYFKYEFTGTRYQLSSSEDGITWDFQGSVESNVPIYVSDVPLQVANNHYTLEMNTSWNEKIDLKHFSIVIDGQEIQYGVEGNTFRVPTIKDGAVIQQAMSDGELGKAYNAGLPIPPQHIHSPIVLNGSNADDGDSGTLVITKASDSNGVHNMKNSKTGEATWNEDTIYGTSDTVQMNAVALRYFVVVANGSINESQMNWSEWASSLQSKANADLSNCTKPHIIETSAKSLMPSWYRIWSDGWVEQGGFVETPADTGSPVTFLKPYKDTNYCILASSTGSTSIGATSLANRRVAMAWVCSETTGYVATMAGTSSSNVSCFWEAKGYIR